MVYRWVELRNVHLQAVTISPDVLHGQAAAGVEATSFDAGETVRMEHSSPDRFEHAHQAVVDDPVRAERKFVDLPFFWLVDRHGNVGCGPVCLGDQELVDVPDDPVYIRIAGADDFEAGLAAARIGVCLPDVRRIRDLHPKHSVSLHDNMLRRRGSPRLLAATALRHVFCPRGLSPKTGLRVQPGGVAASNLYPTRSAPRYSNSNSCDRYSHYGTASRNSCHCSNCRPREAPRK